MSDALKEALVNVVKFHDRACRRGISDTSYLAARDHFDVALDDLKKAIDEALSTERERALREAYETTKTVIRGYWATARVLVADVLIVAIRDALLPDEAEEAARRWADESRTCGPQPEPPGVPYTCPDCGLSTGIPVRDCVSARLHKKVEEAPK